MNKERIEFLELLISGIEEKEDWYETIDAKDYEKYLLVKEWLEDIKREQEVSDGEQLKNFGIIYEKISDRRYLIYKPLTFCDSRLCVGSYNPSDKTIYIENVNIDEAKSIVKYIEENIK